MQSQEASYKLCRVKTLATGDKGIPYVVTHDGRTIRFPDPLIKPNDTVKVDLASNKIVEFAKFEVRFSTRSVPSLLTHLQLLGGGLTRCLAQVGNVVAITAGHNVGRVGTIVSTEKHPGGHNIVHVKDKTGSAWATRMGNVFVLGTGKQPAISLPRSKGIKHSIIEEAARRAQKASK